MNKTKQKRLFTLSYFLEDSILNHCFPQKVFINVFIYIYTYKCRTTIQKNDLYYYKRHFCHTFYLSAVNESEHTSDEMNFIYNGYSDLNEI